MILRLLYYLKRSCQWNYNLQSFFAIDFLFCYHRLLIFVSMSTISSTEYGREGKVSRKCDVYSYGIMLMETFTKKKPTDEIFAGEMSLKRWVGDSLLSCSVTEVADANLLNCEENDFSAREQCVSSIFSLAMDCTVDLPEKRISMKDVANRLVRIRETLSANIDV